MDFISKLFLKLFCEINSFVYLRKIKTFPTLFNPEKIPQELRNLDRWICWKKEIIDGKETKLPYGLNGKADSTDSASWSSFVKTYANYIKNGYDGLWFALGEGYVGIDIDDCVNGEISPIASDVIEKINSYSEYSPSRKGIHIIAKGTKIGAKCKKTYDPKLGLKAFEMYDKSRFFSFTGDVIDNRDTIYERQTELDTLYLRVFGKAEPIYTEPTITDTDLTDEEIIDKAERAANGNKFYRLWRGDTSEYDNDESRADSALCYMIAFWTNDFNRIDSIFRKSGLMRDKWNRADYARRTINSAIRDVREHYKTNQDNNQDKDVQKPIITETIIENGVLVPAPPEEPDTEPIFVNGEGLPNEPIEWILDDFFARKKITWLWGFPSTGKSLFAQMMFLMQDDFDGLLWHREENGGADFNLLYIQGADSSQQELKNRESWVVKKCDVKYNKKLIDLNVANMKSLQSFIALMKEHGKGIDAICFDASSNFHPTVNGIDTNQVDEVMKAFKLIASELNVAVILIGHSNKKGELQGNVKMAGGADIAWKFVAGKKQMYSLTRTKDRNVVNLNMNSIKAKFINGVGFTPTKELFEPKTDSAVDFFGIYETMDNTFTDSDFGKACGLPTLQVTVFLRGLCKDGILRLTGKNKSEYVKVKEENKVASERFGVTEGDVF